MKHSRKTHVHLTNNLRRSHETLTYIFAFDPQDIGVVLTKFREKHVEYSSEIRETTRVLRSFREYFAKSS